MLVTLLVRLLAPLIVEVIRELLDQIASGQQVQLTESTVMRALDKHRDELDRNVRTAMTGVGIHYEG
jgi:hypothetical protein